MLKKLALSCSCFGALCAMDPKPCVNFIEAYDFNLQRMKDQIISDPQSVNCLVGSETILKYTINCMMCTPKSHLESWKGLFRDLVTSPHINVNKESGRYYKSAALLSFFAPLTITRDEDHHQHYSIIMSRADCVELLLAHPDIDIRVKDHRNMTVLDYLDEYRKVNRDYYFNLLALFIKLHDRNQKSWDVIFERMLEKK